MDQNPNSVYSGSDQSDVIFVLAAFIFSFMWERVRSQNVCKGGMH